MSQSDEVDVGVRTLNAKKEHIGAYAQIAPSEMFRFILKGSVGIVRKALLAFLWTVGSRHW
eukprot:1146244-Pelagomonas_calceolata.AAC.1